MLTVSKTEKLMVGYRPPLTSKLTKQGDKQDERQ